MPKYSFPVILLMFISFNSIAQDSLVYHGNNGNGISNSQSPLITVYAEDIRRFPANNFLDAVEGLFPWVFGAQQQPGQFLYILNGRLLADVNSINLNDIEKISFTRNNLYGGLLPFSKAGTFFIDTRPATNKITVKINSQFNWLSNRQQPILPKGSFSGYNSVLLSDNVDNSFGNYSSNHFSIAGSGKKYGFYAGTYFNSSKLPGSKQAVTWAASLQDSNIRKININTTGDQQSYGLFADFNYRFSPTFQAGIMANYSHRRVTLDSTELQSNNISRSNNHVIVKTPYYTFSGAVFVNWQPLPQLQTKFSVEYVSNKLESASVGLLNSDVFSVAYKTDTKYNHQFKNEGIVIRNELKYTLPLKGRFTIGFDMNTLWYKPTTERNEYYSRTSGQGIYLIQSSWWKRTEKLAVANPAFHFSYNGMISGYAGAGYFIGEKQFKNVNSGDKINPYAGLTFNLKNIFETSGDIDVLMLSSAYAKLATGYSDVTGGYNWFPFAASPHLSPYYEGSAIRLGKTEALSLKLTAGFLKSRLMFEMEWSKLRFDKSFLILVPMFPNGFYYYNEQGTETANGFSVLVSSRLIDKKQVKLFSRVNILFPAIKSGTRSTNALNYIDETSVKAGIQHKLVYKNYLVQVNALIHLNHRYSAYNSNTKVTKNDFVLNNLLLGYSVPASTGIFKNSVLFVQARNLFVSEALKALYLYDSYAGIGFNLAL